MKGLLAEDPTKDQTEMPKTKTPTSIIQDNSSEANPHGQPKYFKVFQRFHACIFNLAASITTGKKKSFLFPAYICIC